MSKSFKTYHQLVAEKEQLQQLLEAQKGEERALIFLPQNQKRKNYAPHFKEGSRGAT